MSTTVAKGTLPHGWIVRASKQYKDRIYYFNVNTGVSTWECPNLDPPSRVSEEQKNMEQLKVTPGRTSKSDRGHAVISGTNLSKNEARFSPSESKSPPTAIVVPVVLKNKSAVVSKKEQTKRKLKNESKTDLQNKRKKSDKRGGEKKISPLNKSDDSEDILPLERSKISTIENNHSSPVASSCEPDKEIKDVEMRDVSMDLMEDLTAKKETFFDTTACYYIVVDTNVLISELHLISELKDTPLDGCGPPHIFIPWIVIEELDKLKNQRNPKSSCSRGAAAEAIRYLNSVLSNHPRFHGQSPSEAEEWSKSYSKNNDDKILECCVALMDKMSPEKVILLTNDKNLVNKALICKINVHNFESMMKKVKPDTLFNYQALKNNKKMKERKKEESVNASSSNSQKTAEEAEALRNAQESVKRNIHTIMSTARFHLKDVLSNFFETEMFQAYGPVWIKFPIEKKLLTGILGGIKQYWKMVFSEIFSETNRKSLELLLKKANRPEGFLGDKDDCLVILTAIEDVFRQVQEHRRTIRAPVDLIKDFRISCVKAFSDYSQVESSLRACEENCILELFNADWNAINQLTGLILDYYNIPNDFHYVKFNGLLHEPEVKQILINLYPELKNLKILMKNLLNAVKNCKPTKQCATKLTNALLEFIPKLRVPHEPTTYEFVSAKSLERFFNRAQNRETIEIGIKQAEAFHEKLEEVLYDILKGKLKRPEIETMMCD